MGFPLSSNDPYIKDTGERSTLGKVIGSGGGGGTSELPEYSIADAGKVLTVNNSGSLVWATPAASGNRYAAANINAPVPGVTSNVTEVTT